MHDPLRAKAKVVLYSAATFVGAMGLAAGFGWSQSSSALPTIDEAPRVSADAVRPALDLSEAFVNVAEVVTPAVVRIEATRIVSAPSADDVPEPLQRFFGPGQPESQPRLAGGSGFIISSDGYILTNDHVVADAAEVRVYFPDRRYFDARVIGTDPFTDVAVIKIDTEEDFETMSFGDSEGVEVGEWVLAIGNPGFGAGNQLDYTVTAGIVSARGRGLRLIQNELLNDPRTQDVAGYAIEDFIQTDAVINPGNSGGPLVDIEGRVVGINSAIASQTGFYQGYGFAIPINLARRIMEDLIEYGHVRRARLGVSIDDVAPEDAEAFGLPSVAGVLIQSVEEGTPGAEAGLLQGDVIVAIDGEPVGYVAQLQGRVAMRRPGDRVELTVYRGGEPVDVSLRLGEAPINDAAPVVAAAEAVAEERLGIMVEPLTGELADQFGYPEAGGVVISQVERASAADRRQLLRGERIIAINGDDVDTTEDVRGVLGSVEPGTIVQFVVGRPDGSSRVVNVRMPGG
ncbi:trypsin-like peptidase domain-containing protein [Gemmatimonadota bacterium DH-20]|uniref:Trypsin-like peptidase domain-containing protein n=1 Tax=Gaopeijia maritima TaxID=3119007 RepID=A0ABU9EDM2_9BACT